MNRSSSLLADSIPELNEIQDFTPSNFDEFINPSTSASNSGIFGHWFFTDAIPIWLSYGVSLSIAIAILLIVISGIMIMYSPEDENMKEKAIETITWSIAGIIIIMLSYTIVEIINKISYNTGTNPNIALTVDDNNSIQNLAQGDLRSEIIPQIIQDILKLMGTFAFLLFIYAGAILVMRDGDDEKITKARHFIIYGVIGAAISLLAYLIIEAVIQFQFN